jgi:hypothetical protein
MTETSPQDRGPREAPCPTAQEERSEPINTSLCEVVQHPADFSCKRVRFRASLLTDCMHGAVLISGGCERGIIPGGPVDATADAFFDSACGPAIDLKRKRTATFTSRFRLRSGDRGDLLEIERVERIEIAPR